MSHRALLSGLSLAFPVALFTPTLHAQAQLETSVRQQLRHVDLGLSGIGIFNGSVSGAVTYNGTTQPQSESASNTLGALFTLRYTRSPLIGAEFNYSYARYNETFTAVIPDVQTNVNEYSVGYVAHGPELLGFGIKPFGAIGAGSTAFTPTTFGGQGLREQARATYYYAIGAEAPVLFEGHIGLRAQFRQAFFIAPDFGQNYLTIKQHTSSFEPAVGIYIHF